MPKKKKKNFKSPTKTPRVEDRIVKRPLLLGLWEVFFFFFGMAFGDNRLLP
jgi:hypothetical protein